VQVSAIILLYAKVATMILRVADHRIGSDTVANRRIGTDGVANRRIGNVEVTNHMIGIDWVAPLT